MVGTGDDTLVGGRIKRIEPSVDSTFCLTYGDGVADADVTASIQFHKNHGKKATLTAVQPSGRFGALATEGTAITSFREKPEGDGS